MEVAEDSMSSGIKDHKVTPRMTQGPRSIRRLQRNDNLVDGERVDSQFKGAEDEAGKVEADASVDEEGRLESDGSKGEGPIEGGLSDT